MKNNKAIKIGLQIMPVYQDKKTKKWSFRTYASDVYGNRKQYERNGFITKKEAQAAESKFKLEELNINSNVTFQELYEKYIEYKELQLKAQSLRAIKSRFKNYILPYFKEYKIDKITNNVYVKWQKEIEKKSFKHKYNSTLHGAMVNILNYGVKFYNLKSNIASLSGNFKRKTELKKKVDFWSPEEFNQFINVVNNNVYKTFFNTLYYTGIRQGEALALNWNDFKDNKYLDINKTISKESIDKERVINTPKTSNSIRKIKIDEELIKELNELKEFYKNYEGFSNEWFIFGGLKPLAPTTIGRKKDNYCDKAKVKKIRIHDFRHSHASLLLSMNVPITVISERLGHSDINMTLNTYSHMIPKDEDKAIDILNKMRKS